MSYKIKIFYLFFYFVFSQNIIAQNYPTDYFIWPLENTYRITGSFGAIRANHFHSGIDISTSKKEGLPVKVAADGYVVRIKVSPYGYGNAIYVNHPNGYTTVYGHLQKFSPEIQEFVKEYQYKNKTFVAELFPPRNKFSFRKGDIIALSGNSGGSTGAHLHFEIRDTKSEEIIDPLLFGFRYIDSIAPRINSTYQIFKLNSFEKINAGFYPHITNYWKTDSLGNKYDTVYLKTGTYALGFDAEDFYNDKRIGVGINHSQILENENKIFEMKLDRFAFDETRMINCYIPYNIYYQTGKRYHKAFIENGNTLPFYKSAGNGYFIIKDNQTTEIKLKIFDRYDSSDFARLIIVNNNEINNSWISYINSTSYSDSILILPNSTTLKSDSIFLIKVPKNAFYDTLNLKYNLSEHKYGTGIDFIQKDIPIQKNITIGLKYFGDENLKDKALLYSKETGGIGGEFSHGKIIAQTRNLGDFVIIIDEEAPITKGPWIKNRKISFFAKDIISGLETYNFYIDNEWILAEYDAKYHLLKAVMPNTILGGKHMLKITISDGKKNQKTINKSFILK